MSQFLPRHSRQKSKAAWRVAWFISVAEYPKRPLDFLWLMKSEYNMPKYARFVEHGMQKVKLSSSDRIIDMTIWVDNTYVSLDREELFKLAHSQLTDCRRCRTGTCWLSFSLICPRFRRNFASWLLPIISINRMTYEQIGSLLRGGFCS